MSAAQPQPPRQWQTDSSLVCVRVGMEGESYLVIPRGVQRRYAPGCLPCPGTLMVAKLLLLDVKRNH